MKRFLILFLALLVTPAFAQQQPVPEIPYTSVPNFFKYPSQMNLGDMAGVAVSSKGHIYMLSRSNISGPAYSQMSGQILEFDATGRFIREVAPNLYAFSFGHNMRIDKNDNLWVVDKGSSMVTKISTVTGHVLMVLGRRSESSEHEGYKPAWSPADRGTPKIPPPGIAQFRQPTDIAWDTDGNFYISDGYVNSRVVVFDKDGQQLREWGTFGKEKPGEFNNPHSIAVSARGEVFVADRGNGRTQVFDKNGKYLREIRLQGIPNLIPPGTKEWNNVPGVGVNAPAAPWTLCITPGPNPYLYIGDGWPGRVYKLTLDGTVVGMFGRTGRRLGEFGWVHGIACNSENQLYIADENNWRVQKILLRPDKQKEAAIIAGAKTAAAGN
jgi:hypothetical protein